jgi:hypothetical protein
MDAAPQPPCSEPGPAPAGGRHRYHFANGVFVQTLPRQSLVQYFQLPTPISIVRQVLHCATTAIAKMWAGWFNPFGAWLQYPVQSGMACLAPLVVRFVNQGR